MPPFPTRLKMNQNLFHLRRRMPRAPARLPRRRSPCPYSQPVLRPKTLFRPPRRHILDCRAPGRPAGTSSTAASRLPCRRSPCPYSQPVLRPKTLFRLPRRRMPRAPARLPRRHILDCRAPGRPAGTSSTAASRLPCRRSPCPYSPSVRNTLNIGEILFLSDRKKYGIINSLK